MRKRITLIDLSHRTVRLVQIKSIALFLSLLASFSVKQDKEQSDIDKHIQEMKKIFESAKTVHYFTAKNFAVAAHTSEKTAQRIKRYTETLLDEMLPYFGKPAGITRVYVFDTSSNVLKYKSAICKNGEEFRERMGFYDLSKRSALASMEWGLGWLGDLLLRSLIADDWHDTKPSKWFGVSFVSMLYNSFRTSNGEFKGLNVMSYYRPQVQELHKKGVLAPLENLLKDDYGKLENVSDGVRKQGREFLAYIHSKELLIDFLKKYRETCKTDPTGVTAIESVTGKKIKDTEAAWLKWLMAADGEIGDSAMAKPFPVLGILIKRKGADDKARGVPVYEVCHYSPAKRCGMQNGDIILKINDTAVNTRDDLLNYLHKLPIDSKVTITVKRSDSTVELKVVLDRFIDG